METIGRYRIDGELGKGAMGVVYKATDPNIGRTVALKTMRLDVHGIEAEEMLQRFRNEARAAGVLNHPNVVTVYDAGESDGLFYMAMEVIEGETLQQLLVKHRVLPVEQVLSVSRQAGEGLDYAHQKGIIHRDIKPANIMITTSGLVKIMDFGIAKAGGGLTSTGQVLGTPNYMSPEQVKGKPLDGRTDLFSLGVVIYEMLTGEKPFGAQNVTTIIYKIVHEDPISPRELDVSIHPGLSAVVCRALAKSVEARYQTGAELARDLENYKAFGTDLSATQSMQATGEAAPEMAQAAAATAATTGSAAAVAVASQKSPVAPVEQVQATVPIAVKSGIPKSPAARVTPRKSSTGVNAKSIGYVSAAVLMLILGVLGLRSMRQRVPAVDTPGTVAASETPVKPPPTEPSTTAAATPASSPGTHLTAVPVSETIPAKQAPVPAVTSGVLSVISKPEGATVKMDGKKMNGVTPFTQTDIPAGRHTLQISAPGFVPSTKLVELAAGSSAIADVTLVPSPAMIRVNSSPAGAQIFVDGQQTPKKTPAEFSLAKGDHTFFLRMQGYEEVGDLIALGAGQTTVFSPTLHPTRKAEGNPFKKMGKMFGGEEKGTLAVTTTPPGAVVFVNGRQLPGQTPLNVAVPVGQFYMAIRKSGFGPVQKSLKIEKGKLTSIAQPLTKAD